jgi:hypothetical protein
MVAIDIAKMRNEVLIEVRGRPRRRRMTVLNTRAEHDKLVSELQALPMPIVIGFEATGNYHRPLTGRLLEAGFECQSALDWDCKNASNADPSSNNDHHFDFKDKNRNSPGVTIGADGDPSAIRENVATSGH